MRNAFVLLVVALIPFAAFAGYASNGDPNPTIASVLLTELREQEGQGEDIYAYVVSAGPLKGQVAGAEYVLEIPPETLKSMGAHKGYFVHRVCSTWSTSGIATNLSDPELVTHCTHERITRQEASEAVASLTPSGLVG